MRKINKRKRRTIIIVTVLILIVFGAYLIIENINNDKLPPIDHEEEIQEEEASNEPEPAEEEPMEPEEPDEPEEPIEPEEPAPNQEAEGVEKGILIENPDSLDVIVNKKRNLPENYVPEDLTALNISGGNITETAALLKVTRNTIYNKIKKYNLIIS
jgi:DNA-binding NtrC family response regulator